MTAPVQENQEQNQKLTDKELNFRALEAKYQKQLEQERAARLEAERIANEARQKHSQDDEEDDEPYVAPKKLKKELSRFGEQTIKQTQTEIQKAVQQAKEEAKREAWLDNNPDFYDVLNHAEKLAQRSPQLAKTILEMPEGFERQKLVYQNIKEFGLHKPEEKKQTIQDKIDANRRSPYYQPSGVGSAPYAGQHSDFSPQGQKEAHAKMQELKNRLRL